MLPPFSLERTIDKTVREEWGRILAALVKTLGDFQLAEDCLQDAITVALTHWKANGLPRSPAAWLITTARRKAIDRLRRDNTARAKHIDIAYLLDLENQDSHEMQTDTIPDKRLEMIFTCCHPALEEKTRVALTLRTLGGLSTHEIAQAFLDKPDAMAQRLVRAKKKIALAGIPYEIPQNDALPARISSVLSVIYLIFNAGYSTGAGDTKFRGDLTDEAIRLTRIIRQLLPDETEVTGLLALMLLHDSRRFARSDGQGNMIPLAAQNRARWDQAKIKEGNAILVETLPKQRVGAYQLQAAISAVHAQAVTWDSTDWPQIAALYGLLHAVHPSPVVRINQAIAISYAGTIDAALALMDAAAENGSLDSYQPYFAARADILMRSGDAKGALACFDTAIKLSQNDMEIAFLREKSAHLRRRH